MNNLSQWETWSIAPMNEQVLGPTLDEVQGPIS
jgi:hypothetical protein